MSERRSTRVIAGVGVILLIDGEPEPCMTRNLSRGGMSVATKREVPPETILPFQLIHQGKHLTGKAKVIKCSSDGLGLSFIETDGALGEAIRHLMDEMVQTAGELPEEIAPVSAVCRWISAEKTAWWQVLKRIHHRGMLTDLTLEGAAVQSGIPPLVGAHVMITLPLDEEEVEAQAEVVRHTDIGFAVRFIAPSIPFRRAISQLRRGKFGARFQ
jgi:hypothetical protein